MNKTTGRKKRPKGLRCRNGVWYLDTQFHGVPLSERIGPDLSLAEKILYKRKNEILEGRYLPGQVGRSLTVREGIGTYWREKGKYLKSANCTMHLFNTLDRELGVRTIMGLTVYDAEQYARERMTQRRIIRTKDGIKYGERISPRTAEAELDQLNVMFNWMLKTRRIPYNPIAAYQKVKVPDPRKRMLDEGNANGDEWRRIYNAASDENKRILGLQYETGMRIGEVLNLKRNWCNTFSRKITLPPEVCKSGKGRMIPLSDEAIRILHESVQISPHPELVFPAKTGRPKVPQNYSKTMARITHKAGFARGDVTTHAIRRTRLQIWDRIDERASCAAGGHSDLRVHRRHYTSVMQDQIMSLVNSDNTPTNDTAKAVSL